MFFFFNDTATTEIYTLSLHDALPIYNCGQYYNGPVTQSQYPGNLNLATEANCAFTFDSSSFPSGLNSSYFDITKTGSLHNTSFVFKAHNAVPSGTYMFSATGFIHRWSTGPAPSRIGTQSVILKLTIRAPSAINGFCGLSNGKTFSSAPTSNLCSAGTASSVSGSGPWNWTCNGSNGGTNASCSANKILPTGTLNAKSASCVIPINGSSCPINFSWKTFNPVGTSAVTSSINDLGKSISTTVATINSTDLAGIPFTIPYNGRTFYLYNPGSVPPLATASATSDCDPKTSSWNNSKNICEAISKPTSKIVLSSPIPQSVSVTEGSSSPISASIKTTATNIVTRSVRYYNSFNPYLGVKTKDASDSGITYIIDSGSAKAGKIYTINVSASGVSIYDASSVPSTPSSVSITVTVTSPTPPTTGWLKLSNNPCTIATGASGCNVGLTWEVTNPESTSEITSSIYYPRYHIAYGNSGGKSVYVPYKYRDFYLYNNTKLLAFDTGIANCSSKDKWNGKICERVVIPPPTVNLTAEPTIILAGDPAVLSWKTTNKVNRCDAPWTISTAPNYGFKSVYPTVTTTYGITCTGPGGKASAKATVYIMSGTLTPTSTSCIIATGAKGCNVNLSWNTVNPIGTSAVTAIGMTNVSGNSGSQSFYVPYS